MAIVENINNDRGGRRSRNVVITNCSFDPSLAGKSLADIARRARPCADAGERRRDRHRPAVERRLRRRLPRDQRGRCGALHAVAYTMIASDGEIPVFGQPRRIRAATALRPRPRRLRAREESALASREGRATDVPA